MLTYCAIVLFMLATRSGSFAIWPVLATQLGHRIVGGFVAVLGFAGVFLLASAALAADTAPIGATTVDFTPLIATGVTLLSGIVAVLGRTAVRALVGYLEHKTKLELDTHTREYLDAALDRAVAWGTAKAEQRLTVMAPALDLHNEAVAKAMQYAMARVPDALTHFGITGASLESMIEARMPALWGELPGAPSGEAPLADAAG